MICSVRIEVGVVDESCSKSNHDPRYYLSLLRSLYSALEPECRVSIKDAESSIILREDSLMINIHTYDIPTLRALLNSYLRFIDAAYRSINASRYA
jgi:tRNA threonylcarbamoyladenosine modification (KEOPS) complex  Pcc1 subunit